MTEQARPLFVLGSPRSGTTLLGNYIGGCASVCDLGEFTGFFLSHYIAPREFVRVPSAHKERYLRDLQEHAHAFATRTALNMGCRFYCDSTPWTLWVARELASQLPDAVFVLTLRHYSGVVQSLERSYEDGYEWAGATWSDRARLWRQCYANARFLPPERTIVISYDRLCASPQPTISGLKGRLADIGLDISELDDAHFSRSYATSSSNRRPVIASSAVGGSVTYQPMTSYNAQRWTQAVADEVLPIVQNVDGQLRRLFPEVYTEPLGFTADAR